MGSIGVFDSGIGGFSILKDLVKVFKDQNIYYVADQKHIPYSSKSKEFLIERATQITEFLVNKGCSTIVIACNTSTVFTISALRKKFKKIKFVGVEPAVKTAAKIKDGDILVLASQNTIESKRLDTLVKTHIKDKNVYYQEMSNWVLWAEKGMISEPFVEDHTKEKFKKFQNLNISAIVMACTHYPFFTSYVKKIFKDAVIIDPSKAVAKQAKKIHVPSKVKKRKIILYSSKSKSLIQGTSNLLPFSVDIESASV